MSENKKYYFFKIKDLKIFENPCDPKNVDNSASLKNKVDR